MDMQKVNQKKEVRIVSESEKKAWDEYVLLQDGSIAWQLYDWSRIVARHYDSVFFPLAVFEKDSIQGILPLYALGNGSKKSGELISVPYAVAGGLLASDPHSEALLFEKAKSLLEETNSDRIILKQYRKQAEVDTEVDENYYNRELSLEDDDIWNKFESHNQSMISLTEGMDFQLQLPFEDVDKFYSILILHMKRSGLPCPSKKWIKTLVESGMYKIAILKSEGNIVAATMIKEFKTTISLPFSCRIKTKEKDNRYLYRLYWELIKKYQKLNYSIFHSGRIPVNNETDDYRLGWGGEKKQYYYQYYPRTENRTEFKTRRGLKRRLFSSVWKIMPRLVVEYVGPKITRKFP